MTPTQSCDAAILVLILGWTLMVVPSLMLTFLLIQIRRDQLLHYEVVREWLHRADRPPGAT